MNYFLDTYNAIDMEFHKNKPIYLQIVDVLASKIITKAWTKGMKIPTVKELAKELDVNHNTLMRSIELLQMEKILFAKRGVGLFLTDESYDNALELMRRSFYEEQVPEFFSTMHTLKITLGELIDLYKTNKRENS